MLPKLNRPKAPTKVAVFDDVVKPSSYRTWADEFGRAHFMNHHLRNSFMIQPSSSNTHLRNTATRQQQHIVIFRIKPWTEVIQLHAS
jgi:hypothetical protein